MTASTDKTPARRDKGPVSLSVGSYVIGSVDNSFPVSADDVGTNGEEEERFGFFFLPHRTVTRRAAKYVAGVQVWNAAFFKTR